MKLSWQILKLQLKETFAIAYGNYDYREALLVALSKHGETGYGECTAINYYNINLAEFDLKLKAIQQFVEKHTIESPYAFSEFLFSLQLHPFLQSALDCAFWDLLGKLEKKTFFDIAQVPNNISIESSITISIDTTEKQIEKITNSNWTHFKVKCKNYNEKQLQQLAALPQQIAIDSNASFTAANCFQIAKNKSFTKFKYFEQPMKIGSENFSVLSENDAINWMADEDCQTLTDLEKLKNHYQSINIKLVKCGGITPALQLISEAKKMNFKIMIGCMTETTVGISADAVLAPLCDFADLDGANLLANDIATGTQIHHGKIELSTNYGLGIKLL